MKCWDGSKQKHLPETEHRKGDQLKVDLVLFVALSYGGSVFLSFCIFGQSNCDQKKKNERGQATEGDKGVGDGKEMHMHCHLAANTFISVSGVCVRAMRLAWTAQRSEEKETKNNKHRNIRW